MGDVIFLETYEFQTHERAFRSLIRKFGCAEDIELQNEFFQKAMGQFLRTARLRKCLDRNHVAGRVGLTESELTAIEDGLILPPSDLYVRLSDFYQIGLERLRFERANGSDIL